MLAIHLQSEYIFSFFGLRMTNTFFTSLIVVLILLTFTIWFWLRRHHTQGLLFQGMRVFVFTVLKLTDSVTQDRTLSKKILPLVATFFLFIVTGNLLALIPGFLGSFFVKTAHGTVSLLRSPNSDLTTTLALALFSVSATQYVSARTLGWKKYLGRFFNFRSPLKFVLGFFELISESIKVLSFSFRLFGNMFAGEVLLLVTAFLIPYVIPVPFLILEVFVGIIQAFIFAVLTLSFIKTSIVKEKISF